MLIRKRGIYERTSRGEELVEPLKNLLQQIQQTLMPPHFEPGSYEGEFNICTMDYGEMIIVPRLMNAISKKAPNAKINIIHRPKNHTSEVLMGEADLIFAAILANDIKNCISQPLFTDNYVCVMDNNHPLASEDMGLDDYLKYHHAVTLSGNHEMSQVDIVLKKSDTVEASKNLALTS